MLITVCSFLQGVKVLHLYGDLFGQQSGSGMVTVVVVVVVVGYKLFQQSLMVTFGVLTYLPLSH